MTTLENENKQLKKQIALLKKALDKALEENCCVEAGYTQECHRCQAEAQICKKHTKGYTICQGSGCLDDNSPYVPIYCDGCNSKYKCSLCETTLCNTCATTDNCIKCDVLVCDKCIFDHVCKKEIPYTRFKK